LEAEKLKVIAKGMGYEAEIVSGVTMLIIMRSGNMVNGYQDIRDELPYKPNTTNNDQMVKIMGKLLDVFLEVRVRAVDETEIYWCELIHQEHEYMDVEDMGKTINEAVCNAAWEYFHQQLEQD